MNEPSLTLNGIFFFAAFNLRLPAAYCETKLKISGQDYYIYPIYMASHQEGLHWKKKKTENVKPYSRLVPFQDDNKEIPMENLNFSRQTLKDNTFEHLRLLVVLNV